MAKSGASKGAKNMKIFNDGVLEGVNVAMLPHEFESIQRQYGNKKYGEYTIEDKKNVINYHKKQAKAKKGKV